MPRVTAGAARSSATPKISVTSELFSISAILAVLGITISGDYEVASITNANAYTIILRSRLARARPAAAHPLPANTNTKSRCLHTALVRATEADAEAPQG